MTRTGGLRASRVVSELGPHEWAKWAYGSRLGADRRVVRVERKSRVRRICRESLSPYLPPFRTCASTSCSAPSTATPPIRATTRSSAVSSASSELPARRAGCMRELADEERIRRFMRALGDAASREGECFLTGGTTAVLLGWRATTLDVDIRLEPQQDEVLRALSRIKEELGGNVELAAPADLIPLPDR